MRTLISGGTLVTADGSYVADVLGDGERIAEIGTGLGDHVAADEKNQASGRYVIPVRAEAKGRVKGIVHDQSASGATLFVEPLAVVELNNTWTQAALDEERRLAAEQDGRKDEAARIWKALAGDAPPGAEWLPGVQRALARNIPLFGVCLGHQGMAEGRGARLGVLDTPMHGKPARIHHDGKGLFAGLPSPFSAARYHSLYVIRESLPPELEVSAESEDGVIMALRHK